MTADGATPVRAERAGFWGLCFNERNLPVRRNSQRKLDSVVLWGGSIADHLWSGGDASENFTAMVAFDFLSISSVSRDRHHGICVARLIRTTTFWETEPFKMNSNLCKAFEDALKNFGASTRRLLEFNRADGVGFYNVQSARPSFQRIRLNRFEATVLVIPVRNITIPSQRQTRK